MAPSDSYDNSDVLSSSRAGSPTGARHFLNRSNESLRISKVNHTAPDFIVEQENSADSRIDVDWRSLTSPACLPLTSPKKIRGEDLRNVCKYKQGAPQSQEPEESDNLCDSDNNTLTPAERFFELQAQRITQGFQYMRLHEPWKAKQGNAQGKETIGLFLSPYVVELSLDHNSKLIETNEFIKTHILQPTNKHTEYHFAFW